MAGGTVIFSESSSLLKELAGSRCFPCLPTPQVLGCRNCSRLSCGNLELCVLKMQSDLRSVVVKGRISCRLPVTVRFIIWGSQKYLRYSLFNPHKIWGTIFATLPLAFTTSLYVFIPFVSPFFLHSAWIPVVRNCSYSFFNMHNFLYPLSFCQTCLENPNPWWIQPHLACWIEMTKNFTVVQSKVIIAHGIQTRQCLAIPWSFSDMLTFSFFGVITAVSPVFSKLQLHRCLSFST